jgi:hypothetical protein
VLQFGHGSSPWKCLAQVMNFTERFALQFGHGSSPWKCCF